MPRKSEGRQKIEIVKITKESSSSVAFSKRRSGVFKKASELCTLCGAQIAVIVHSHTKKKVYSFGKPDVEEVVNRFLNPNPNNIPDPPITSTSQFVQILRDASIKELYTQLTNLQSELESEKKAGEELKKTRKESQENHWWDKPTESMGLADLEQYKMAISQLIDVARKHADEKRMA